MSTTDEDLMLYRDGELDHAEARRVEEVLAANLADHEKLAALTQLGDVVKEHYHRASADARLGGLWRRVERELERDANAESTRHRGAGWLPSLRGYLATSVVSAAAGAAITIWASQVPRGDGARRASRQSAEVEALEVSEGTGTIFQIPGDDEDAPTTVIWVTPDEPIVVPVAEDPI